MIQKAANKKRSSSKSPSADLVSVITPTYNSVATVAQTVTSVQAQTYPHWELIIADDGSKDTTLSLLQQLAAQDSRIQIIQLPSNQGPAKARNAAIAKAKGRYIVFCDADDLWYPDKLERQLGLMQTKNCPFCYAAYNITIGTDNTVRETRRVPATLTYNQLLYDRAIGCLTAIYDTQALGKVFMPDILKRQDYALWLKLLKTGITAHGIQEPLALYRKQRRSVSSNPAKAAWYVWKVYREVEQFSVVKSLWYFVSYAVLSVWQRGVQKIRRLMNRQTPVKANNSPHYTG